MDLNLLRTFEAVARTGNFTAAAKRLGMDKSRVSRSIRALEETLGTPLLLRTTRVVRLTAEGAALAARVAPLLGELEQALRLVPDQRSAPEGEVVVTATPDVGRALLAPVLAAFRVQYPAVRVRVRLEQALVDLVRDEVDLALRVGRPGPGSVVARKLGELTAGFFAAPAYLERRGVPTSLEALAAHEGLWPVPDPGQRSFSVRPLGRKPVPAAVDCEDFGLLVAVARAGGGVAVLPTFLANQDVAAGSLMRVLPSVNLAGAPLFLVSRPSRSLPPRVTALRMFLLERLRVT
ncbi:LysR family transcriptional regulator [Archangium lipolyticum]|uniref:LysR family transcriptional regulator n=1 Tax=Archangium lipolyticum TaxID=2970465 RepID=UPI00214A3954|nr:LysR family transcriptional regulator [Archangium lipolyticum]